MTIQEKIDELKTLTDWFYGDDFALDEAVGRYKQATKLAHEIEVDLDDMKNEIELISSTAESDKKDVEKEEE